MKASSPFFFLLPLSALLASSTATPNTIQLLFATTHPTTHAPLEFNMTYYLESHIPLVESLWGPHGAKSWSTVEFQNPNPLTGEAPPYLFQVTVNWDAPQEEIVKAVVDNVPVTGPDVENFSNVQPVIWYGEAGPGGVVGVGREEE